MAQRQDPETLARYQPGISADPRVQRILSSASDPRSKMFQLNALSVQLQKEGLLPPSYTISPTGELQYFNHSDLPSKETLAAWAIMSGAAAPFMAGPAAAGGSTASLGPVAASGGTTAATVPPALAAVGGSAATGIGSRLVEAGLRAGVPLAVSQLANRNSGGTTTPNGGGTTDPQMQSLLDLMNRRLSRTEPVHEAAMAMAQRMAPSGPPSPRMLQAVQSAGAPRPQQPFSPDVLAAIQRLTGGR